jgi:Tfp pilus assembly protein PilF
VTIDFDLQKIKQKNEALAKAAETGTLTKEQERDMSAEAKAQLEKGGKERAATLAKNKALNESYGAGMTALNAKDYKTAIENFDKAAVVDPKQVAVWSHEATAYEGLASTLTGADQEAANNKAVDCYRKALEITPNDGGMHNNLGLVLVRLKKLDEGKAELAKAAEMDPTAAGKYYFNMGAVMRNTNQDDAALDAFKKAVAADPKYAEAWYQIGNLLSNKLTMDKDGKPIAPDGMKEALQTYLQLAPEGHNADAAKGLLSVLDTAQATTYVNPDAPKKKKKN